MPLRPSQVETLRFVDESLVGRTMTECSQRFALYRSAMWDHLYTLRRSGHLKQHQSRFYLTQLGREALEGQR